MHVPVGGVEPEYDKNEKAALKYAKENHMEDLDDVEDEVEASKEGWASASVQ